MEYSRAVGPIPSDDRSDSSALKKSNAIGFWRSGRLTTCTRRIHYAFLLWALAEKINANFKFWIWKLLPSGPGLSTSPSRMHTHAWLFHPAMLASAVLRDSDTTLPLTEWWEPMTTCQGSWRWIVGRALANLPTTKSENWMVNLPWIG
jgi:hypothetical protein